MSPTISRNPYPLVADAARYNRFATALDFHSKAYRKSRLHKGNNLLIKSRSASRKSLEKLGRQIPNLADFAFTNSLGVYQSVYKVEPSDCIRLCWTL